MDSEKEDRVDDYWVYADTLKIALNGMFRIWLTSDEGQNVVRESIEPYVQLVVDKMAERLRGEINEEIERAVQNSDIEYYRNELEGIVRDSIDTDNFESIAQDAAREVAIETIEGATYTVEVSV